MTEKLILATLPQWLADLTRKAPPTHSPGNTRIVGELDLQINIDRAIDYLTSRAPEAVEGDTGDNNTIIVVNNVLDYGLSLEQALETMLDHWNDTKAHPPWEPERLQEKIASAWKSRQNAVGERGGVDPTTEFDPIELDTKPEPAHIKANAPKKKHKVERFHEVADQAQTAMVDALIEGLIDVAAMSIIYGDSNSGKTFIALYLAMHIALGRPMQGRRVKQKAVVYIAAEGGRGLAKRIAALRKEFDISGDVPFVFIRSPIDLLRADGDTNELIALIKEAAAMLGVEIGLVVVDTLSRAMAGGDENSSTDMGAFVTHIDRMRVSTGAHMMVIHHSGKDRAKGARGHSLLRAATDTEIEIADNVLTVTKQRDLEGALQISFALKSVEIGDVEKDGEVVKVTSAVVEWKTASEFEAVALTSTEQEWYDALSARILDEAEETGVDVDKFLINLEFIRDTMSRENDTKSDGVIAPTRQNVTKKMTLMTQKGHFKKAQRGQWVIVQ